MTFNFGDDNVLKHCYNVYISPSGANGFNNSEQISATYSLTPVSTFADGFVKVGAIAENPTITTAEGDTVALGDCTEKILSETVEFSTEILEVTSPNWAELRDHVHNTDCDIIFAEATDDDDAVGVASIKCSVQMSITGNDQNKITVTGKLETSDAYSNSKFGFVDLS